MHNTKIDYKKTHAALYNPKNQDWAWIDVPPMQYLMIDGSGNPNTAPAYRAAVETLYSAAYPLKFTSKKTQGRDYTNPPLEGLWYTADHGIITTGDKNAYHWTMMLMQPDWITADMVEEAITAAHAKKPALPHDALRFTPYHEGPSLQRLHIGSYDDEAESLATLHQHIMPTGGWTYNGHHHEIYLSDPRKTAADKLKTILRQPVRPQDD